MYYWITYIYIWWWWWLCLILYAIWWVQDIWFSVFVHVYDNEHVMNSSYWGKPQHRTLCGPSVLQDPWGCDGQGSTEGSGGIPFDSRRYIELSHVSIYIYLYIHTYVYIMYVYIYIYVYLDMYVYTYKYIHTNSFLQSIEFLACSILPWRCKMCFCPWP